MIDTDIHFSVDAQRILDFLPEPWRTRFASGNRGPGHLGYWNPNGVERSDAVTVGGARIDASPQTLADRDGAPLATEPVAPARDAVARDA